MADYFDVMSKHFRNLFELLLCALPRQYSGSQVPPINRNDPDAPQNLGDLLNKFPAVITDLNWFFNYSIFSYLKFFDQSLSEDDPENYYFEREWRVLGEVKFDIKDVRRVLLPEEYAKRFREDLPDYYGQITFLE